MNCLVNLIAGEPNVDADRLGAVGHSFGAQAVLIWSAQTNARVRAVVSLDSTVDYEPENPQDDKPLADRLEGHLIHAALMLFARKELSPDFRLFDNAARGERYLVRVPHLEHDDFVAQLVIAGDLCHNGVAPIRPLYEQVCARTLQFCDAYLKKDEPSATSLRAYVNAGDGDPNEHRLTLEFRS
jgi:pimeloyl-ACP methyl ester carboxylesterase